MIIQIILISNHMVPKSILPNPARPIMIPIISGISDFKSMHNIGYLFISHFNYDMKMLWQNHPGCRAIHSPTCEKDICIFKEDGLTSKCNIGDEISWIFKMRNKSPLVVYIRINSTNSFIVTVIFFYIIIINITYSKSDWLK